MLKFLVLSWVGCALITASALAEEDKTQKPEMFSIKPYVYTIKGAKYAVAWAYGTEPMPPSPEVRLRWNAEDQVLKGVEENGLFTAILPLSKCEFGDAAYQVAGDSEFHPINDIPCKDTHVTTRFTFMADTQEGTEYSSQFAAQVKDYNGSAVIIGGDLVQTGDDYKDWLGFFDALNPAIERQILIPVVGNHEYRHTPGVPYWNHFFQTEANEDFYAMDVGPVHVIALNSCFADDPDMRIKQLGWLQKELAKKNRWKVVFFHHPPFSKSIANNKYAPKKEWLALQEDYVPLFEKYHVDLVLNGHTHLYEHSFKDGVHYLTMGPAGGIMGTYGATNPFMIETHAIRTIAELEASQNELRAVTTTIDGKTLSDFLLSKPLKDPSEDPTTNPTTELEATGTSQE